MAERDKSSSASQTQGWDVDHVKKRLDMLDERLDNIDSVVTAVAERVMNRPITVIITCPHCGKRIEIALIGSEKPT